MKEHHGAVGSVVKEILRSSCWVSDSAKIVVVRLDVFTLRRKNKSALRECMHQMRAWGSSAAVRWVQTLSYAARQMAAWRASTLQRSSGLVWVAKVQRRAADHGHEDAGGANGALRVDRLRGTDTRGR
jgi:hypothetical protein